MNKLLFTLNQPYPYYNRTEKLPRFALAIFLSVFLFLYLFSPFSVNETEHKFSYPVICMTHALNASVIFFIYFLFINTIFPASSLEENWKIYKAILTISILLIFIGTGSFLIRPLIYDNPDNFSLHYFINETFNTFLVGSLVFAGFTLIDFYRLLKSNRSAVAGFEQQLKQNGLPDTSKESLEITVEQETYKINTAHFIFAKAEGNYVNFYFNNNSNIEKQLKRVSLKNVEEQLTPLSNFILRTHRAYLVNTLHIKHMTGNAQGYQLFFENIDFPVPVSRTMIPSFKLMMKNK